LAAAPGLLPATVTTLGLTEATGAATTVATVAATNPDKVAQVGTQLSAGAQKVFDFMGPNATGKLNKAGDLIVMSEDKLTKFRVDLKNPGNDIPHMHLEQFVNGKWRDAIPGIHRIYPQR
jgi:hypothetical protein